MRGPGTHQTALAVHTNGLGECLACEQLESRSMMTAVFDAMPVTSTPGPNLATQVVADFDGDGNNDIAAIDFNTQKTIVFRRGLGDGSFDTPRLTTLNVRASTLSAGQVLPGGGSELIVIGGSGTPVAFDPARGGYRVTFVRLLTFTSSTGGLSVSKVLNVVAPPEGAWLSSIPIIGEFTGDSSPDIAFQPDTRDGRLVVVGNFTGTPRVQRTFVTPTPMGMGGFVPGSPMGVDVDGDGRTDIAMFTSSGYVALFNSPSGLSATIHQLGLSSMFTWQFADMNGDGKADAVSMWVPPAERNNTDSSRYVVVRVKLGVGDGTFGAIQTISRITTSGVLTGGAYPANNDETLVVSPDIDGDGRADIVYVSRFTLADRSSWAVNERVIALTRSSAGAWLQPYDALPPHEDAASSDTGPMTNFSGLAYLDFKDLNNDGSADLIDTHKAGLAVYLAQPS